MRADDVTPGSWAGPTRDYLGYGPEVPKVEWPGGARVAVSIIINWEEGSELSFWHGDRANPQGLLETPASTGPEVRDLGAESTFEYGSRAGVWRLARLFDEFHIPTTLFATGVALLRNEEFAAWVREGGHEPAGHGLRWDRMWEFTEDEEREQIRLTVEAIERATGTRPRGWYSRYSASVNTRRLLVEEGGFTYDSDAYNDDLPYYQEVAGRQHLVLPYSFTLNDGRFATSPGNMDPTGFADHLIRHFDELWREGETHPRMMSIGLHPRISGQPSRTSALRQFIEHCRAKGDVWFCRRIDIAEHWLANHPADA
jgi:peptidoglycan/xylan/chitin deacetylase (PgdA/CDA1 family)